MTATTHEAPDWREYRMDYDEPHRELEPLEDEVCIVGEALEALETCGILPHTEYDHTRMLAHRDAVCERFEIPWTAISPRVQRLLYAINAIAQPPTMIAAGIFCGNTFVSNAGAAIGPGACYRAGRLVGVEIDRGSAGLAARNLATLEPGGVAAIACEDAVDTAAHFAGPIHLLYLDADGRPGQGKGVYLDILKAAYDRIPEGGIVLAHNSVNCARRLKHYLAFVRDPAHMKASVNVILDPEGLEVSVR
jgi:predicted O-methyltransferase YrrM